jgi:sigma-E factor negative regulatory protein RseA
MSGMGYTGLQMAGGTMKSSDNDNAQISLLADGELAQTQVKQCLTQMRDDEARTTWDLYHHIGDIIRSDAMAAPLSDGFAARFAERFDSEPALLAPRRRWSGVGAWSTTLVAVAATGFGFFVAPSLFHRLQPAPPAASALANSAPVSHGSLLANAKQANASATTQADYIRMHQASYSPWYGTLPGTRSPSDSEIAR